ncbi:adenylate/guanylate cyclase domain-containing protein [Acidomonas methanolica]|uniref:Two component hybrid sensor histidine kinase and transcriptional regulator/adenylate/guanylate cyclase n=1 Tax=Acidomonas methanolica NBRC 104435 TaxID=1231351 RepID=A0A023D2K5_ACIMT|nr:cache domain-containing protein [Acidomonas methanolica]MBU2654605.1 GAF domain-containing protein [Acidomonas methanolica]TCS27478.1 adenylate cyclase [Acidomonas methanolica]GAJ28041.1 two component hybrid sensor histidine kinase and transcriptional regulator/adenylate/guanylate cyclase [Acidomonas methanolica NBRC 104435]GBQ50566.1 two component hybrid sensor histidine kinase and regulator [Acidomonas methanolica]GEK98615.1 hypothetical protein AME01nite_11140 [Acidomonas methanolica NBR
MRSVEIVDPTGTKPRQRRRTLVQVGGPILGVLLVVVVILVVALRSYVTNRDGVLSLTRQMFLIQEDEISLRVSNYLSPAPATAIIAHDLLATESLVSPPKIFQAYARSMLVHVPQIESFYLADDTGAFWYVGRNPHLHFAGIEYAHFETIGGRDVFHHWYYDASGKLTGENDTDAAGYDPRTHAWYRGAIRLDHLLWTDPYAFRDTGNFVVTAATSMTYTNGHAGVFAINISLNRLTAFLESVHLGKSGRAIIVDGDGHLVAGAGIELAAKAADWDFARMKLTAAREPVFARAFAMYNVFGPGPQIIHADGRDYVTVAAPLDHGKQKKWMVILEAQESDFAAFTRAAGWQNLMFSLVVVLLAALLAGFLVRQNRMTEKARRILIAERARREEETEVLARLAGEPDLFEAEHEVPALTEILAEATEARAVSLWRLVEDGDRLLCEDAYDRGEDAHSTGLELGRDDVAGLFGVIETGESVAVAEAATDDRTRSFHRLFLRNHGGIGVLLVPIMIRGRPLGLVVLEDVRRPGSAAVLGEFVAGIAAVRFTASSHVASGEVHDRRSEGAAGALRVEEVFLLAPGGDADAPLPAGRYPLVSAAMVVFGFTSSPTIDSDVDLLPVVQRLAAQMQTIAREHGLFSVQALGNRILLVGGCGKEEDRAAALRLADAVLAVRELCMVTLAEAELMTNFRIGLHIGPALGAVLGDEPGVFNLWGEAVQFAELLAETMPDAATIQVSESAYAVLKEAFLFRPRGEFYLPRTGITRSFVLAGHR